MDWQGLLNWSIQAQGECKVDTSLRPLNPDEKKWLEEALGQYNIDIVTGGVTLGQGDEELNPED